MKKILVVEDSSFQRKMITGLIKELGHDFETATNGLEGFHKIQEGEYDLVMSDLLMPELDGMGMIKKVKDELTYNGPFLVFTADIQKPVVSEIKDLGVEHFLNKPLEEDVFKAKLAEIFG